MRKTYNIAYSSIASLCLMMCIVSACDIKKDTHAGTGSADSSQVSALADSAYHLYEQERYSEGLTIGKEAAQGASALKDSVILSDCYSTMLCCYQRLGLIDSAIHVAKIQLELNRQMGDNQMLSNDFNNIAYIYLADNRPEEAKEFIESAIEYEKKVEGQPRLSTRYGIAGEVYARLGQNEKALEYVQKAYDIDHEAHDTLKYSRRLSQMGDVYKAMERMAEAEKCYLKAVEGLESVGEMHSYGISCNRLGEIYLKAKKTPQAIHYLLKALAITEQSGELRELVEVYKQLYEAYSMTGDKQANHYLVLYTQSKDSLRTLESARALSEFKVRYDTDTKDKQLKEKENRLSASMFLNKASIAIILIILGIVAALCMFIYKRIRKQNHLAKQVEKLQEGMEEQNTRIMLMINKDMQDEVSALDTNDKAFMEKLDQAIFELMKQNKLTADNVANYLNVTSQQLRRKIQTTAKMGSNEYITKVRMECAKHLLLAQPQYPIKEVSFMCGFDEPANFTRAFKNAVGVTPSQYRRNPEESHTDNNQQTDEETED